MVHKNNNQHKHTTPTPNPATTITLQNAPTGTATGTLANSSEAKKIEISYSITSNKMVGITIPLLMAVWVDYGLTGAMEQIHCKLTLMVQHLQTRQAILLFVMIH